MIKNYFKIAFRNLVKKKVLSFINIFGLALGMAACLSIFYYVNYEFSYSKFFTDSDQIYRAYFLRQMGDGSTRVYMNAGTALKPKLDEIPDIASSFRLIPIDYQNNSLIYDHSSGREIVEQLGVQYADADVQKTLDLKMLSGSFDKMIEPMKMVLSRSVADKFFSPDEAIGKVIKLSGNIGEREYEVVGVMDDLPTNTHFELSVLLSYPSFEVVEGKEAVSWNNMQAQTYIKSKYEAERVSEALNNNVTSLEVFNSDESVWNLKILPLIDLHLTTVDEGGILNKSAETLLLGLAVIGLFILCIAWINFINLSTARAMERAREVGVRKVLGSYISQIRIQFLIESFVINILAAVLALTIVQIALPQIFNIKGLMDIAASDKLHFWSLFIGILIVGSFFSGLYPAFILSSIKPITVLKGKLANQKSGNYLRKGLVVFQFAASAFMIIGTYGVYEQITYMKNKELGLNINDILIIDSPPGDVMNGQDFYKAVNSFKEEIIKLNAINHMTASSDVPGQDTGWLTSLKKPGEPDKERKRISLLACDKDFDKTYGLELVAGRFYQEGDGTFDKGDFVINEEAVQYLGFSSPEEAIGKQLIEGRMFPELTIIGVVKNFHQQSLKQAIRPLALVNSSWSNYYSLALNINMDLPADKRASNLKSDIKEVEKIWKRFFPEFPFDYTFLDQRFNAQYESDQKFGFIITLFATLSMIIACLGLLGLASYTVTQRTKEIGIRKVLGASVFKIFELLTLQYFWLILVSGIIALPAAYYGLTKWLTAYPYHIDLDWWIFALPIVVILLVAIITIASQVINATLKNPIDSLRYE